MSLRDDLKNFIPMYLWESIEHPEGYIVSNEEFNMRWNLAQAQGDQQANTLRDTLQMLYGTVLNDTDGASHINVDLQEYTAKEVKGVLLEVDQRLKSNAQALVIHKASADHDSRYYTKQELEGYLRGGNTIIKREVFTIISADNGDRTFTYQDANGNDIIGSIDIDGYQMFTLQLGTYAPGQEMIEATINDALTRSQTSGGLHEITENVVAITPEGNGAEVTFKYFERVGLLGEHALSHQSGGTDTITIDELMLEATLKTKINNNTVLANNAQSTANTANSKADNAQSTANIANSKADNAQSTANIANSKADTALSRLAVKISVGVVAPSNPTLNDVWIDTSVEE